MSRETAQRATFKDLIAKKIQKEQDKFETKDIYIPSMDKTLTFKKPSDDLILDVINELDNEEDIKKMVEGFEKLIYRSCEMLQDPELHKELDIQDPFDVVAVLFSLTEKMEIGEELMDWVGMSDKTKYKQVKN